MSWHVGRIGTLRLALLVVITGCATSDASHVRLLAPEPSGTVAGFDRMLVAGFLTGHAPDVHVRFDVNKETARILRNALRARTSLRVLETEPFLLDHGVPESLASAARATSTAVDSVGRETSEAVFSDVTFWKRIGEEYGEPLIVTGTVTFRSAASRYEERTVGRRSMRQWRPGFSLSGRLVLISGKTGAIVDSVTLRTRTAHATTGRESALSIYFRLMDSAVPSVLTFFGQGAAQERVLLR